MVSPLHCTEIANPRSAIEDLADKNMAMLKVGELKAMSKLCVNTIHFHYVDLMGYGIHTKLAGKGLSPLLFAGSCQLGKTRRSTHHFIRAIYRIANKTVKETFELVGSEAPGDVRASCIQPFLLKPHFSAMPSSSMTSSAWSIAQSVKLSMTLWSDALMPSFRMELTARPKSQRRKCGSVARVSFGMSALGNESRYC